MRRPLAIALLAAGLSALATPVPSSAADRCRRVPGEHELARSAQAVVFERTLAHRRPFYLQTITGCSRRSGRRRVLDVLQPRSTSDPIKLLGLKLAGTRVAYAMVLAAPGEDQRTTLITEDAVHDGRRHDLGGTWPFLGTGVKRNLVSWAIDAEGDVAWIAPDSTMSFPRPSRSLVVWRPGLGRRQIDARAVLSRLTLRDGVVRWRRNGRPRSADLTAVSRSACPGPKATIGTLDVDLVLLSSGLVATACLRATGRHVATGSQVSQFQRTVAPVIDANGPYVAVHGNRDRIFGWLLIDLDQGRAAFESGIPHDVTITTHGSSAWLIDNDFWVRDGRGRRRVEFSIFGTGPLLRDGSTITWSGGGPSVTLNP